MADRPAPALGLRAGDRERLARLTRSSTVEAGLVLRAGIVLAAADGEANERIAERVGASKVTVLKWRSRYQAQGLAGLGDQARSGRPRVLDHRAIVAEMLKAPPRKFGVTHWSSRLLGRHVKVGNGTVG